MFRNPWTLLWLVPAIGGTVLLHAWAATRRRRLSATFGEPATIARLTPAETPARRRLKAALQIAAAALILIALAGPQWGVELLATRSEARQVFILVDTSLSMTAQDVEPTRLEKAKRELSLLLDTFKGERVGVIAFAGNAAILCPLTQDADAAKQILSSISVGSIPEPGTAIGTAVRLGVESLGRTQGGKALVLLTDGEDHHTDPLGAAVEAASSGVKIYAIGIGTPEGNPLPLKEEASNALTGYKKDRKGQTVISRLGEKTLIDMAAATGGAYWRSSPSEDEVTEIARQISGLEKSQGFLGSSHQYKNRFLFPLALAFLLLLIELMIPLRNARKKILLLLALCAWAPGARAAGTEAELREGNRLYGKSQYQAALEEYSRARRPGDARPDFNSADALYRLEDYDEAVGKFQRLAEDPKHPRALRSAAYYNLGDALVRRRDYARAVDAYRRAVVLAPKDPDARHNLAVALRMLKDPPPPPKKCDNPKKKPEDQKSKGGGQNPPPPTPPRPQDRMAKDDAQRIMRSVAEKEKAAQKMLRQMSPRQNRTSPEEDW